MCTYGARVKMAFPVFPCSRGWKITPYPKKSMFCWKEMRRSLDTGKQGMHPFKKTKNDEIKTKT